MSYFLPNTICLNFLARNSKWQSRRGKPVSLYSEADSHFRSFSQKFDPKDSSDDIGSVQDWWGSIGGSRSTFPAIRPTFLRLYDKAIRANPKKIKVKLFYICFNFKTRLHRCKGTGCPELGVISKYPLKTHYDCNTNK